ncbi:MAG TPA: carboxypeptidase-like regulatory domain-containing protein [Pyrinomonadaceae bacterium]|nr:carboxypeptidase-like regulatory domain-containing protein [Pyrinomonadaceae bacterium]
MTKLTSSLIAAVFLLILPVVCFAQTTSATSAVTGTVTDAQGAVVTGATVTLVDTKTSQEKTTVTNDRGVYLFAQLPPGQGYKLTFAAPGFQTLELSGIVLGVGNTETHNAQLTVGQVSSSVVVTAEAGATLNTTDASIGNVIEERRLKELPIQFRGSPAPLLGLQPGVVGNNVGTGATNRVGSVTGSRADQGNITVDGIDANDQATGQAFATTGNAPIDAIQEFRTVSANPAASEGRSSGGQIEIITKSGTNDFHGSLREYNRTAATAANSFFNNKNGVERPQLTRNQFGGSIGGPVYLPHFGEGGPTYFSGKDKLFFFFDYEGRRDAQGQSYSRIVPLAHLRNGGLGFVNRNAGCAANSRLNSNPNCITILTPQQVAAIDPLHLGGNQSLLNFVNQRYPLPNDFTLGDGVNTAGFRFNVPSHRADNIYTGRVDYNISNVQRLFVRVNKNNNIQTDTVNSVAAQFPGDPETSQIVTGDWAVAVGHNWTITPNFVNSATVGITKSVLDFPNFFHPSLPNSYAFAPLSAPFADFRTQARDVPVWTYRDDVTWNKGSHGILFGASLKTINQQTVLTSDYNFPVVGLGGSFPTSLGTSAAANALRPGTLLNNATARNNFDSALTFLLGTIPSVTTRFNYDASGNALPLNTGRIRDWRYVEYEFYAGDNWKIRNDLSLTYGVRWHIYPAPYETHGLQTLQNVDFETLFNTRIANGLAGIATPSSEPFLTYTRGGKGNDARPFYDTDKNNFGPRLGFSWNPSIKSGLLGKIFGDRKMVIRGGGTVTYDRPGGGITFLQDQSTYVLDTVVTNNFPATNGAVALGTFPRFSSVNSVPVTNVAPPVTVPFTPNVVNGVGIGSQTQATNYAVDPNFQIPYSIQYTFGFQRELPGNFIFEASYVGRQARKLFTLADAAQIVDFKDAGSGQFMIGALNQLQDQINAGGAITPIAWFENQMNSRSIATFGVPCSGLGLGPSCTDLVANFTGFEVSIGDTADTIEALRRNGLLGPNVGLSSQFAVNAYVTNKGSSSYDGMLLSLRKRFSKGFQFDLNYTWSHSIDNQSTVANTTTAGGLICDATNLRVCRGNSDFDIRHLMNLNGIWELPIGRGHMIAGDAPNWVNAVIGGWEVSGIFTARSGLPFGLATASWPRTFIFDGANGVPAMLSGDLSVLRASIHNTPNGQIQFFADPNAVHNPNTGTGVAQYPRHGQAGSRNVLRSQPFWNVDSLLMKNFKLPWEGQRIQFRWEAYNLFNHNVFAPPAIDIGSTNLGSITTVQSTARVMQFGLRWEF